MKTSPRSKVDMLMVPCMNHQTSLDMEANVVDIAATMLLLVERADLIVFARAR